MLFFTNTTISHAITMKWLSCLHLAFLWDNELYVVRLSNGLLSPHQFILKSKVLPQYFQIRLTDHRWAFCKQNIDQNVWPGVTGGWLQMAFRKKKYVCCIKTFVLAENTPPFFGLSKNFDVLSRGTQVASIVEEKLPTPSCYHTLLLL